MGSFLDDNISQIAGSEYADLFDGSFVFPADRQATHLDPSVDGVTITSGTWLVDGSAVAISGDGSNWLGKSVTNLIKFRYPVKSLVLGGGSGMLYLRKDKTV